MGNFKSYCRNSVQPYALFIVAAVLAYLPVSSMAFSLKNDIISLEYPIKFYISQCIHNGENPLWFNTWAMGFPLESIITWSIYSPLQLLFASIFNYNLYTLHLEFIFYISFSGCCMYYLLKKHFIRDKQIAWLLSMCYMLSGFNVGSSQWLLYISAAGFLPLAICALLDLLKNPGRKTAIIITIVYYCMLTSVYVAFSIIITYLLLGITIYWLSRSAFTKIKLSRNLLLYLTISCLLIILVCGTGLYYTLQVLEHLERAKAIASDPVFFNTNYLPPKGLIGLLVPACTAKINIIGTEGSMINTYMGMFPILLLPLSFRIINLRNKTAMLLLLLSLLFLCISFGAVTPLRSWLNILPGFSYFRNPGLFRLFFICFFLLFTARALSDYSLSQIINTQKLRKHAFYVMLLLALTYVIILLFNFNLKYLSSFSITSIKNIIGTATSGSLLMLNAFLQLVILISLFITYKKRKINLAMVLFTTDLICNTLICTPFFTVSSHSVKQVNNLLGPIKGFPVQPQYLSNVPTTYHIGTAIWDNINVYKKEVSGLDSYWGPLKLKEFQPADSMNKSEFTHKVIYSDDIPQDSFLIKSQKPDLVSTQVYAVRGGNIHFLQNYYPGWKAYFNGRPVKLNISTVGMEVDVSSAGILDFKYEKNNLLIIIIITDMVMIITTFLIIFMNIRKNFRSSSLSLQY